jgi:hypothetical protein
LDLWQEFLESPGREYRPCLQHNEHDRNRRRNPYEP